MVKKARKNPMLSSKIQKGVTARKKSTARGGAASKKETKTMRKGYIRGSD